MRVVFASPIPACCEQRATKDISHDIRLSACPYPAWKIFVYHRVHLRSFIVTNIGRLQGSITSVGVGNHRGSWEGRSHPKVSQNVTSSQPGTLVYYYSSGRKPVTSIPIGRDAARHHGSPPVFRMVCLCQPSSQGSTSGR